MTNEQKALVELELGRAILAFHDIDDSDKMKTYIKEYTKEYCKMHNLDVFEAIDVVKAIIKSKRELTEFKYEKFDDIGKLMSDDDEQK